MDAPTYQERRFYDDGWTKEVDAHFLGMLALQQQLGNFTYGEKNYYAIGIAIDAIFDHCGKVFSYGDCEHCLTKLFDRYCCFEWMLSLPDVVYDPVTNYVNSYASTWEFMYRVWSSTCPTFL